jgi:hypothetical protein
MEYLIKMIQSDPKKVANAIQQPFQRWMVVAIMVFNVHMDNFTLNHYTGKLRETLYWFNRERWYTDKEVKNKRLQLPETKNNIRFTRGTHCRTIIDACNCKYNEGGIGSCKGIAEGTGRRITSDNGNARRTTVGIYEENR